MNMLGPNFFKSHKACIINLDNVKKIEYNESLIVFQNDDSMYLLSTRMKKKLREYVASR